MSIVAAILVAQATAPTQPPLPEVLIVPLPPVPIPAPPPAVVAPPAPPPPPIWTSHKAHPRPATPVGNPGEWVTTPDYPIAALRDHREGIASFRLKVDRAGQVSGCTITVSSGSPDLDAATCALVGQRARFLPATDPKGVATAGDYSGRVRWIIPEDAVPNPWLGPDGRLQSSTVTIRFFIEPDGSTSDCVVIFADSAETLASPQGPCASSVPYKPFLDADGKPVRKRVGVTISTAVEDQPKP